jgi:hypothetical protein
MALTIVGLVGGFDVLPLQFSLFVPQVSACAESKAGQSHAEAKAEGRRQNGRVKPAKATAGRMKKEEGRNGNCRVWMGQNGPRTGIDNPGFAGRKYRYYERQNAQYLAAA